MAKGMIPAAPARNRDRLCRGQPVLPDVAVLGQSQGGRGGARRSWARSRERRAELAARRNRAVLAILVRTGHAPSMHTA